MLKCAGLSYGSGLHLLAYTEAGDLYTWGYNTYSQLGNGNTNHTLTPSTVGGVLSGKIVIQVDIFLFESVFINYSTYFNIFKGWMRQSPLLSINERW